MQIHQMVYFSSVLVSVITLLCVLFKMVNPCYEKQKQEIGLGPLLGTKFSLSFLLLDGVGRGLVCSREQGRYAGGYS